MITNQNNSNSYRHTHNGVDSPVIYNPQAALTGADSAALTTGGTEAMISTDAFIIDNMRTRINEIEARLKLLNLLQ